MHNVVLLLIFCAFFPLYSLPSLHPGLSLSAKCIKMPTAHVLEERLRSAGFGQIVKRTSIVKNLSQIERKALEIQTIIRHEMVNFIRAGNVPWNKEKALCIEEQILHAATHEIAKIVPARPSKKNRPIVQDFRIVAERSVQI